jgi:SAM-dependent methyltransferase
MSSYTGKHAEYYDTFYTDKPYAQEASFVNTRLQKYSRGECGRLLELACGTGSHALEMEKLGYEIVATDYSPDLLAVAERKAKKAGSRIQFRLQDMRALTPAEKPYDAVYCLFDSIGYVQTNEALRQVLEGVHSQLRPAGLFVYEFWHAAAMLKSFEPRREKRWKTPEGELVRRASTHLDIEKQLAIVTYDIDEVGKNGNSAHLQESQTNRYFLVQEMRAFLEAAGFIVLEFSRAYEDGAPIDADTWHILAVAQRD